MQVNALESVLKSCYYFADVLPFCGDPRAILCRGLLGQQDTINRMLLILGFCSTQT